ncbi:MAG TPA: TadA family conjugal transfer-associated ATPase [Natronosporangium sp.]|nr:TadA family conjugal transfer-associated ATPase [Natronosporangium sp.]
MTGAAAAVGAAGGSPILPSTTVAELTGQLRQRFVDRRVPASGAAVVAAVSEQPVAAALGSTALLQLSGQVHADLVGTGPLAPLLADPEVTDILVNRDTVWVDRGQGLRRAEVSVGSPEQVRRLAQRLAAAGGRRLDDSSPCVDVMLQDGSRLHAVLPPVAVDGPYLCLRTFRPRPFQLADLVAAGTVSEPVAEVLAAIVAARLAYLVTGGTGGGKSTLLATLLSLVPPDERIVVVEDAAELRPAHPHVVSLQTRTANVEGAGEVGLRELVRHALRMRPDRLVVGECRGAEIVDLLAALNTGHEGGAGTLHANTPADVPARLEALGLLGGLPRAVLHAQVIAALQVVVHVRREPGRRVVDAICLLLPEGPERLVTAVPAWRRGGGVGPAGPVLGRMLRDRGVAVPPLLVGGGER